MFELLVQKETSADALLTGIVPWRSLRNSPQEGSCVVITLVENYGTSLLKNRTFWVVTLLSQMSNKFCYWYILNFTRILVTHSPFQFFEILLFSCICFFPQLLFVWPFCFPVLILYVYSYRSTVLLVGRSQDRFRVVSVTGDFPRSYRQNHVPWGRLSL